MNWGQVVGGLGDSGNARKKTFFFQLTSSLNQTNMALFLLISSICDHWICDVEEVTCLEERLR